MTSLTSQLLLMSSVRDPFNVARRTDEGRLRCFLWYPARGRCDGPLRLEADCAAAGRHSITPPISFCQMIDSPWVLATMFLLVSPLQTRPFPSIDRNTPLPLL